MCFDAVNAAGGIHGRKIRLVVEDMGYQMPKAMRAYNFLNSAASLRFTTTPLLIHYDNRPPLGCKRSHQQVVISFADNSGARDRDVADLGVGEQPCQLRHLVAQGSSDFPDHDIHPLML